MNNTQNNTYNPWEAFSPFFDEIIKGENNNSAVFRGLMKTNILEFDDRFEFKIEMPNVKKENIKVSLEEGNLIVSATMEKDHVEGAKVILREINHGTFKRSYYVGEKVKNEDIKAKLEDGILNLTITKRVEEPESSSFINID